MTVLPSAVMMQPSLFQCRRRSLQAAGGRIFHDSHYTEICRKNPPPEITNPAAGKRGKRREAMVLTRRRQNCEAAKSKKTDRRLRLSGCIGQIQSAGDLSETPWILRQRSQAFSGAGQRKNLPRQRRGGLCLFGNGRGDGGFGAACPAGNGSRGGSVRQSALMRGAFCPGGSCPRSWR